MASRLLDGLDARIAAAATPVDRACLQLRKATYLARQGHDGDAAATVAAVRQAFDKAPNAEVTAWVSLVESLIQFYRHPDPEAMDRLRRAEVLARAIRHTELMALCAAWLAHMEFNARRMPQMVDHAAQALQLAEASHHATMARVSLVIADAFQYAGRLDQAKPWYAAVRDQALAEGDDSMISAMLHNSATFRANNVRLGEAFGNAQAVQAAQALMEAESTGNFDSGIGTASLTLFVPLLRAQLLAVQGRYAEALPLFEANLDRVGEQGMERLKMNFLADRAYCQLRLGRVESARRDIASALESESSDCDPDDLAMLHALVARMLDELGEQVLAKRHQKLANEHLIAHTTLQLDLLERMSRQLPATPDGAFPSDKR